MATTTIADKTLTCGHCGGQHFNHRRAQLNTALATLFGVDALNTSADVYACRSCGRLEWFLEPDLGYLSAAAPSAEGTPAMECPSCNMIIAAGRPMCGSCGWRRPRAD